MDKALFTITCTTCKARLAVRNEAAIGTILECPKCESMVQILPPEGWTSTAVPATGQGQSGPPPLTRVADCAITLEIEPSGGMLWRTAGLWAAGLVVTLAVVCGLWMQFAPKPPVEPADPPVEQANQEKNQEEEETLTAQATDGDAQTDAGPSPPLPAQAAATTEPDAAAKQPEKSPAAKPETEKPKPPSLATDGQPPQAAPPPAPPLFPPAPEEPAAPAEVRKLPPAAVDIAQLMDAPIAALQLDGYPLNRAVDLLSGISAVPLSLDPDALEYLGISPRDQVALHAEATTVGEALRAMLAKRGLAVESNGATASITLPAAARQTPRLVRYTVADLTGEDVAAAERLAELVRRLVTPLSWREQGSAGTIAADGKTLAIEQTDEVHRQVLAFCEKLRAARGLPLRSRESPERFTLKTREQIAAKMLDRPVTCNFRQPAPLARILDYLSEASGATILVDHAALAEDGTSPQVEAALVAEKQILRDALDAVLKPLGLAWRAVGEEMIQVTTPDALEEHLELEFHPVGRWLEAGVKPERLVEQLQARVAPTSWSDVGGQAEVYFDPASRSLLVLQSQPAQRTIECLLAGSLPNK